MKYLQSSILTIYCFFAFISPAIAEQFTQLDCLVKPEMYVDISSSVDGVLETILVNKSDDIKKGQILAQLESSVEQAKVNLARHQANINNPVHTKKIRLEFTKRHSQRIENLHRKKAVSFKDKDEADTEVAIAKADLLQAKIERKKAKLQLELALAELNRRTIRSPIDGIVIQRYIMPGESVDDRPILQLAKIDPLLVEVVAPSELFGLIKKDMKVQIYPEAPANSTYQATVSVVDKIIDAASGSFSVRLALPNPDDKLIGGTKCMARFNVSELTLQRD
jgi:RND family efflux transporter MFP subunit